MVYVITFSSTFFLAGCHVKVSYPTAETLTTDQPETIKIPSKLRLQQLVTVTLLDFNKALESEDFTRFHENIATPFKYQTSPEYFTQCFTSLIKENVTMVGINHDSIRLDAGSGGLAAGRGDEHRS